MINSTIIWPKVPIGEVCDLNPRDRGPADASSHVSFIPMPAVSDTEGLVLEHGTRVFSEVAKGYTRFREGDVIFAKITPCMENGKIAIATGLHNGFACGSTEFHVLRAHACLLPEYLWHFLRQTSFREDAERHMTGAVGQRRVPLQYLASYLIPLPPIDEQHRIVSKLKGILRRMRTIRDGLDPISKLVTRYKQAMLTVAFRGDLTAGWRAENRGGAWQSETLGNLALDIRYGTAVKCHYEPKATPVLRIPNMGAGRIDVSDLKYGVFDERDIAKLALRQGDLLVIRSNGSPDLVGRIAIVDGPAVGYLFAGYLIRLRLDETRVLPDFVALAFEAPMVRRVVELLAKSTSGVHNINSEQLRSLVIPLPPLAEQDEMVRRVRAKFLQIDSLLDETTKAKALVDRLGRAFLARAFSGQLLAPDLVAPADALAAAE